MFFYGANLNTSAIWNIVCFIRHVKDNLTKRAHFKYMSMCVR
jgi:hypothetical protein